MHHPQHPRSGLLRVAAVTAVALTLISAGTAANATPTEPVTPTSDASWTRVATLKADRHASQIQAGLLASRIDHLDVQATQAREVAEAATAAYVDARFETAASVPAGHFLAAAVTTSHALDAPDAAAARTSAGARTSADTGAKASTGTSAKAGTSAKSSAGTGSSATTSSTTTTSSDSAAGTRTGTGVLLTPADDPTVRLARAAEARAEAERALEKRLTRLTEERAKLQFLLDPAEDADPDALQSKAEKTGKAIAQGEAAGRLAGEERRKADEEAARVAAEAEAARVAAEQAWLNRWVDPGVGSIGDTYGPRAVICTGAGCTSPFHAGVDVITGCDAPLYAAHAGTVLQASYSGTLGNYIKIGHGDVATGYGHLDSYNVSAGQWVNAGDVIGWAGSTGASTGCHLHFEVYDGADQRMDPIPFLASRGVTLGS